MYRSTHLVSVTVGEFLALLSLTRLFTNFIDLSLPITCFRRVAEAQMALVQVQQKSPFCDSHLIHLL